MTGIERAKAQDWDIPDVMLGMVENPRHPFTEPLVKIVGSVADEHLNKGCTILEIGAGSGFLKELLPMGLRDSLISSDYNLRNLQAGLGRRALTPLVASAYELPIRGGSVDSVIDLDAFDTFPSLDSAFSEVHRVLRPGGKFIHFQINAPSDDILEHTQPDMVWLPATRKTDPQKHVIGVPKNELMSALESGNVADLVKQYLLSFVNDPIQRLVVEDDPDANRFIDMTRGYIENLGLSQVLIPSYYEYLKDQFIASATKSGLEIVEYGYKKASVPNGTETSRGLILGRETSDSYHAQALGVQAVTSAAMQVFVAQKH